MRCDFRCEPSVYFFFRVGDAGSYIRKICGDQIADGCKDMWNIGEDGEFSTCWRDLGLPGLWYMMGVLKILPMCMRWELATDV